MGYFRTADLELELPNLLPRVCDPFGQHDQESKPVGYTESLPKETAKSDWLLRKCSSSTFYETCAPSNWNQEFLIPVFELPIAIVFHVPLEKGNAGSGTRLEFAVQ